MEDFWVLLDVGHSLLTPGKCMTDPDTKEFFYEYKFNREVGKLVYDGLKERGINVQYVLDPDEKRDTPLNERVANANALCRKYGKNNCLYLSLHGNACSDGKTWSTARGWEAYTSPGTTKSDHYASLFYQEADKVLPQYGMFTRKDKSDGDEDYEDRFYVLVHTYCPAVLLEQGFFTNKTDQEFMRSDVGKSEFANICIRAIERIIAERKAA